MTKDETLKYNIEEVYLVELANHYKELVEQFPNENFGGVIYVPVEYHEWIKFTSFYTSQLFNKFKEILGDSLVEFTNLHISYDELRNQIVIGYKVKRNKL